MGTHAHICAHARTDHGIQDGLFIHKLGHFHDIVHGTRHDFFMNELRIEFLMEWLALLDRHGFDPAALELSELGKKTLKETVF